jgi:ribosomal protein S18 acetylase RimI-like enzyme
MAPVQIAELTIERWPDVLSLMGRTHGICVREADSAERVAAYLRRNPGMSFVALHEGRVVGCAMCGHDGRRGYLNHVLVDAAHRRAGIATALVTRCLDRLEEQGTSVRPTRSGRPSGRAAAGSGETTCRSSRS